MRCRAYAQGVGGARGADRTSCTLTRVTIIAVVEVSARRAASHRASPGAVSRAANTWDATAESWSAPWRGWLASVASLSATSGAPTSTSPSRRSPAPSSAELRPNGLSVTLRPSVAGACGSFELAGRQRMNRSQKELPVRTGTYCSPRLLRGGDACHVACPLSFIMRRSPEALSQ